MDTPPETPVIESPAAKPEVSPTSTTPTQASKRKKVFQAIGAGLGLLALIGIGYVVFRPGSSTDWSPKVSVYYLK